MTISAHHALGSFFLSETLHCKWIWFYPSKSLFDAIEDWWWHTGLFLDLGPANERRRYKVTLSLIGWAQTLNQPWTSSIDLAWSHGTCWMNNSTAAKREEICLSVQILEMAWDTRQMVFREKNITTNLSYRKLFNIFLSVLRNVLYYHKKCIINSNGMRMLIA